MDNPNGIYGGGGGGGGGNRNPHQNVQEPNYSGPYGAGQDPTTGAALGAGKGKGGTKQQIRRQTFGQLLELLLRHGATDPTILNREIQGIQRGNEANVNSMEEALAGQGYSSGVGQALVGAQKAAGTEAVAGARAREAAAQEQRQRQNLLLTLELLINPKLQRRGQDIQKYIATHSNKQGTDYGGLLGGLGKLLQGLNTGKDTKKTDYYNNDTYGDTYTETIGSGNEGYM